MRAKQDTDQFAYCRLSDPGLVVDLSHPALKIERQADGSVVIDIGTLMDYLAAQGSALIVDAPTTRYRIVLPEHRRSPESTRAVEHEWLRQLRRADPTTAWEIRESAA